MSTAFKASDRISKELQRQDVWSMVNGAAAELKSPPANLGQGFMDFAPPHWLTEAAKGCFDSVATNQYSPTRGRPRLMEAIAKAYSPLYKRQIDPKSEIVITAGANEGFYSAFAGLLDKGDEVIVMEPFFDQYISNIEFNGGVVKYVRIKPPKDAGERNVSSRDWKLDLDDLRAAITPRTKILMLNTPHNPIGKIFDESELRAIGDIAIEHNLIVLSDEVYDRLDYSPQVRLASLSDELAKRTITIGSAGKTFGCTGWRVGWLIGPSDLIRYAAAAHTRICFVANSPLQEATAIAFERAQEENYYAGTVEAYKRRLRILCDTFDDLGLPYTIPDGSYFLLVHFGKVKIPDPFVKDVPATVTEGRAKDFLLCYFLLKELGVVSIPPTEFCTTPDLEDYLRFAFCKTEETLLLAKEKLQGLRQYIQ
ncbi:arylformamidase [Savitreella phatthalungensis]